MTGCGLTPAQNRPVNYYDTLQQACFGEADTTIREENKPVALAPQSPVADEKSGAWAFLSKYLLGNGKFWQTRGAVGCASQPTNEACSVSDKPNYPEYISPNPTSVNASDLKNGVLLKWEPESQPALVNCDGTTNNIKVVCKFKDGDLEASPNAEGKLVISKTLTSALASPVECDVVYVNPNDPGQSITIEKAFPLYGPTVVLDSGKVDMCGQYPNPVFLPGYEMSITNLTGENINPTNDIYVNQDFKISFPVNGIKDCHGDLASTRTDLKVEVIYDNGSYDMVKSQDGANYTAQFHFINSGSKKIGIKVNDPTSNGESYYSFDVYVKKETAQQKQVCYSVPDPSGPATPVNDVPIYQGDGTTFNWVLTNVIDCNEEPLNLTSNNAGTMLFHPAVQYDAGKRELTVAGPLLPTKLGGAFAVTMSDNSGNKKVLNLYKSSNPLQLDTVIAYFKQNSPADWFLKGGQVFGADNYRFWVTDPAGQNGPFTDGQDTSYSFVPLLFGEYTLHFALTPYTKDPNHILSVAAKFTVHAVNCGNSPPVSSQVIPGQIDRGADQMLSFFASFVQDGCGEAVVFDAPTVQAALDDVLLPGYIFNYDPATKKILITNAYLRSLSPNGSKILTNPVSLPFNDQAGKPAGAVAVYLPIVFDPKLIIPNSGTHAGENFSLFLDPRVLNATAKIDVLDLNGTVVTSLNDFFGSLSIAQDGTYRVKATVSPARGNAPYEVTTPDLLQVYKAQ